MFGVSNSQSTTNGGSTAEVFAPVRWYFRNTTFNTTPSWGTGATS